MNKSTQRQTKSNQQSAQSENINIETPWLTLKEAAAYVKLNKRTLANYVCKGLVPVHINVAGGKRFSKDDLDRWISATKKGGFDY